MWSPRTICGILKDGRYWESKLAEGHVPSEAYVSTKYDFGILCLLPARKIENFIRTKYESKRWVMDGPMPDPSSLDTEGDDDVVSPFEACILRDAY